MKILFVCTGNTCRSSMAEAIARQLLEDRSGEIKDIEFGSAGVAAYPGDRASQGALAAMAERNIALDRHRASRLTPAEVDGATLILTMTLMHREYARSQFPAAAGKIFTLAEYAGEHGDVPDPIGQPIDSYRQCALRLEYLISRVLDRLKQ